MAESSRKFPSSTLCDAGLLLCAYATPSQQEYSAYHVHDVLVSRIVLLLLQQKEAIVRRTLQTYAVWPHNAMVKSTTNLFEGMFCCWQAFHLPWIMETVVTLRIKSCVNPTPATLPALSWQHPWRPLRARRSIRNTTPLGCVPRQLACVRLSTTVLQQSSYGRAARGMWSSHSKRVSP